MAADQDDLAWIEAQGDRRNEALLELLASPRERIPQRIERELAALGPAILPALRATLAHRDWYWAAARAARVFELLAAHHPQECLPAVEDLLDALDQDDGDFLHEPARRALVLLGPAAAPAVEKQLQQAEDEYGALSDLLAGFPTRRSAEILHDLLLDDPEGPREIRSAIVSLAWSGSVEALIEAGFDGLDDEHWAGALLDLCAIHGVTHPHDLRWHEVVAEGFARRAARREELWSLRTPGSTSRPGARQPERSPTSPAEKAKARKRRQEQRRQRQQQRKKTKKKHGRR